MYVFIKHFEFSLAQLGPKIDPPPFYKAKQTNRILGVLACKKERYIF
jgi:hypothetical protein